MVRVSAGMVEGMEARVLLSIRFLMFLKVFDSFVYARPVRVLVVCAHFCNQVGLF